MDLQKLFDAAKADLDENGFVGMDFNMCVMCIIAKRTGIKVNFRQGRIPATGMEPTYEAKLEYWARKHRWNHNSEDDMLAYASTKYKVV